MAIGGLLSGCPMDRVARYMESARRCKEEFRYLADKSAVSALILFAMSHSFIGSETGREYHDALHQAKQVYNGLPEMDPLVSCFMVYRNFVDGTDLLTLSLIESSNPLNAFGRVMDTTGMKIRTEGAKRVREGVVRGQDQKLVPRNHGAHPSFVLVDGK